MLGIEVHRDMSRYLLSLSQNAYINHVLKRFSMGGCSTDDAPFVKGDRSTKS